MRCRGFSLAVLAAVVASSVTLADSNLHGRRQGRITVRSDGFIPEPANDSSGQLSVDLDVPRGGIGPGTAASLVSQSASILMGLILAMNSGFINGCALSGTVTADGSMQAVAAVTASWTNSALALAAGNSAKCAFFAKVIVSFIFGSMIAGYMEPTPSQFLVSSKNYAGPLTVAAGAVALATVFLEDLGKVKLGFYLLAIANGINNSVTSTLSTNLCRTAHFTGISSDIGTFMGQILRGNKANAFKLKVFATLAAAFWSGGYLSYALSKAHGASILYASVVVYLLVAFGYDKLAKTIF